MKKTALAMIVAMVTAFSCATPDGTPKKPDADTVHIAPADTLKYRADSTTKY
ncbi:hypothetical protein GWC95_09400 [Sediminibacterium roseum]|uniref:Uncharacterized protein n=1 Tax=Sediminibacterium roseum TaxID=1978412 RepID=A0ABW9ZUU1_9BACT|nr:hypothetical protein [Sediminibacterium roseum]NCI50137.1 hypothetical protein [Sediminibacterium roseum]